MAESVLDMIGDTPMVRLNRLYRGGNALYLKLEKCNPGGSVKDRVALSMLRNAERDGTLAPGKTVIEATSGNTGIGLAVVCRAMGYDLVLVMPENMTMERRQIATILGAQVVLTPADKGMDGAQDHAVKMAAADPEKYFMPDQYSNKYNMLAHYEGTGPEIWRDTDGKITHFVCGLGTSGTAMGVSKYLRERNPDVKIIGVMPHPDSPVQGLKNFDTQYVPALWDRNCVDDVRYAMNSEAEDTVRTLAISEGIFVGLSSGAILKIAMDVASEAEDATIVAIAPDGGERYLTTRICDPDRCKACMDKFGFKCSYSTGEPILSAFS